ncbi:hypothetical protein NP493_68g03002 [Ridgeia piscesae]|uniref:Uncharacterized protein n=1 Tax=Ridgeia piscesae TaxID=27915 RepID=A0AAD9UIP5_RIDPI|nr:hypothetical protein NP493_68g03002 [Ridgeia piscesae]
MGDGSEDTVIDAIHAAEREDTWLVIDQLHLTSDSFFKQLGYHLHRIAKSLVAEEKEGSNLLVWLVSEPCGRIPLDILQDVHTLSWQTLVSLTPQAPADGSTQLSPCSSVDSMLAHGQCTG